MNRFKFYFMVMLIFLFALTSCKNKAPTEPESSQSGICFTAEKGFFVTIHHLWRDGTNYTRKIEASAFKETITRNSETHELEWRNIVRSWTDEIILSFDVKIDGQDFSFPEDGCGDIANYKVGFKLDGVKYIYKANCHKRYYPCGYYIEAQGNIPEQYNIIGSKSIADCQADRNQIILSFVNEINRWSLYITYFNENGTEILFQSYPADTSIIKNRDVLGASMSADIAGPINSVSGSNTISDISFLAERVGEIPPPKPQFVTHNTGNLQVSIFENGNIGHLGNTDEGDGVRYKGHEDALYSAGIILGTRSRASVNGHIASFLINNDIKRIEYLTGFYSLPPHWDQVASARFSDSYAPDPYYIAIKQTSLSNTGENSVFIQYSLTSDNAYDDLYVGIFADWDIGNYQANSGGYDSLRNMAYQFESGGASDPYYYGIIALNGMAGARVTTNGIDNTIRDSSFTWISTFKNESFDTLGDYRMWIGSGPFSCLAGDTINISFAFVAGDDLSDLKANADAAIQKYESGFVQKMAIKNRYYFDKKAWKMKLYDILK